MIEYLENGNLPEDEKQCKKLVLEHPQYELIDGVLYSENPAAPGSWRIVVPDVVACWRVAGGAWWQICGTLFREEGV